MALRENSSSEGGSVDFNFRLKRKRHIIVGLNHSREIAVYTCVLSLWFCDPAQEVLPFYPNKIICPDITVAPNKGIELS
jgi:hypothetical protein